MFCVGDWILRGGGLSTPEFAFTHNQDLDNRVHLFQVESEVTGTNKEGHWNILSGGGYRATKISKLPGQQCSWWHPVCKAKDGGSAGCGVALGSSWSRTLISPFPCCACACGLGCDPEFLVPMFSKPVSPAFSVIP